MVSRQWLSGVAAAALLAGFSAAPAQASTVIWDLALEFSGAATPAGAVKVTIKDVTAPPADAVDITFDFISGGTLSSFEFIDEITLNFDPEGSVGTLSFTPQSGNTAPLATISAGANSYKADGDGNYDLKFDFPSAGGSRFTWGESITYRATGVTGMTASSFVALSQPAGGSGPFYVAAHVQGIGPTGNQSGWVTRVPVPAALPLVLAGLAGLGFVGWRQRLARA
jgi:hypothetical protein